MSDYSPFIVINDKSLPLNPPFENKNCAQLFRLNPSSHAFLPTAVEEKHLKCIPGIYTWVFHQP